MILRVTDGEVAYNPEVYVLSTDEFAMREYHPFIATGRWNRAEIDLSDKIPSGYVKELLAKTKVIPVFLSSKIDVKVMSLLCEILPDEAPRLRQAFMRGTIESLVDEYKEIYKWMSA